MKALYVNRVSKRLFGAMLSLMMFVTLAFSMTVYAAEVNQNADNVLFDVEYKDLSSEIKIKISEDGFKSLPSAVKKRTI